MVSQEQIETFLNGEDPEKYIVALEYDYRIRKNIQSHTRPNTG